MRQVKHKYSNLVVLALVHGHCCYLFDCRLFVLSAEQVARTMDAEGVSPG